MAIPLTKAQKEIMSEFYTKEPLKVVFNKKERNKIWSIAKERLDLTEIKPLLQERCPALLHQIVKSYDTGRNIQPAVFSECVYAQTLANLFGLSTFVNCFNNLSFIPADTLDLLQSYSLTPRYAYSTCDKTRMLIQAGGCGGVDSALITVVDLNIYTIEFKEISAKTSEHDLPKYGEDGKLVAPQDFLDRFPQFAAMLSQHTETRIFDIMGHNIHSFTPESVAVATSGNPTKKYADVCCTEDKSGYLTMMPLNQISKWAEIKGEIRTAGRNHSTVWTPIALKDFIIAKSGRIVGNSASIDKSKLNLRKERGGHQKVSGYQINQLFFVYKEHCTEQGNEIVFNLYNVRQLKPTIAGKVFFSSLKYNDVKTFYEF